MRLSQVLFRADEEQTEYDNENLVMGNKRGKQTDSKLKRLIKENKNLK